MKGIQRNAEQQIPEGCAMQPGVCSHCCERPHKTLQRCITADVCTPLMPGRAVSKMTYRGARRTADA